MPTDLLLAMPGGSEWIIIIVLLGYLYFWIKALIEIGKSNYNDQATKIIWFIVVFFLNFFGLLAYYIFGRNAQRI